MICEDRFEQLSAFTDGELEPSEMAEVTRHLATCPKCLQQLSELTALRADLAEAFANEDVSEALLNRIGAALDAATTDLPPGAAAAGGRVIPFRRRFRPRIVTALASSVVTATIAATMVFTLVKQPSNDIDLSAVRDARLRTSLLAYETPGQVQGKVAGFRIAGARYDVVAGHSARIVTYDGVAGSVTLCSWSAHGEPAHGVRAASYRGMAILYWNDGTTEYWAVSESHNNALGGFVKNVRKESV
jgi:anti-sigma factor RsiW